MGLIHLILFGLEIFLWVLAREKQGKQWERPGKGPHSFPTKSVALNGRKKVEKS